jgi:excisionase family DNA binding protein
VAQQRECANGADRLGRSFLIEDAARMLGVSRRTVYYRIRAGMLMTIRTRGGSQRVLLSSIEALLDAEREAGGELPVGAMAGGGRAGAADGPQPAG